MNRKSRLITLHGFEQIPGAVTDIGYSVREMDRWWLVVAREFATPGYRMAYYSGLWLEGEPEAGYPRLCLDWTDDMLLFDHETAKRFKKDLQKTFSHETWGVVNFRDLTRNGVPGMTDTIRPGSREVLSWPFIHKYGQTFPCPRQNDELG